MTPNDPGVAAASFERATLSPDETVAVGVRLGRCLQPGVTVALHGNLGAGKTTLVRGVAAGAGSRDRVTSPTFTFINEYRTPTGWTIYHVDGYRLAEGDAAVREAATIGLDELLAAPDAVVVIEWAERIAGWLPSDHLSIDLTTLRGAPDERRITCTAHGPASAQVLACLRASTEA